MDIKRGECSKPSCSPSMLLTVCSVWKEIYMTLCSVCADMSKLAGSMQHNHLPDGRGTYYPILFYTVLLFGLTELQVQIGWIDNVHMSSFGLIAVIRVNWAFICSPQDVEVRWVDIES